MLKLKYFLFYIFSILYCTVLNAQTGIGTTTPNASAKLDVFATNKGFLPPRVTLTSGTDVATIASPAEGLLVYNLGSVGLQAGYYYWNGANWATIATATSAGNGVMAMDMFKLYSKHIRMLQVILQMPMDIRLQCRFQVGIYLIFLVLVI